MKSAQPYTRNLYSGFAQGPIWYLAGLTHVFTFSRFSEVYRRCVGGFSGAGNGQRPIPPKDSGRFSRSFRATAFLAKTSHPVPVILTEILAAPPSAPGSAAN